MVLWNGEEVISGAASGDGAIRVTIHDRGTVWRILTDPFFQFPEAYTNGKLDIDGDLEYVMCLVARCAASAPPVATRWLTLIEKALHWGSRTTLSASHKNIHHHYDIGNEFYRLWLDENLLYTCAYFEDPNASIEAAQIAKMDHVCRKVWLQPGETVIEAGCGWGGFALHMARHYGVRVRAYNISTEQVNAARAAPRPRDWTIASSSSSTTGGTSPASATSLCRSACSSTSGSKTTASWETSSMVASRRRAAG